MLSVTDLTAEHIRLWRKRKPDEATQDRIIELERLIAKTRGKTSQEVRLKEQAAIKIGQNDPFAIAILKSGMRDALRLVKAA